MLKIGLTGGIGSGKSTVGHLFSLLNIPIYPADQRAKQLMVEDRELRTQIEDLFGSEAFRRDGELNRNWLASRVFTNHEELQKLNEIVHPAVGRDVQRWFDRQSGVPYAIEEAALLVETGSFRQLDRLIVVTAPLETRIQRVCQRDGVEEEQVRDRMENQADESDLLKHADFVIRNDGKHLLVPQVISIDRSLRRASHEH